MQKTSKFALLSVMLQLCQGGLRTQRFDGKYLPIARILLVPHLFRTYGYADE